MRLVRAQRKTEGENPGTNLGIIDGNMMNILGLLATIVIPIVAMILLRQYRNTFQPPRRAAKDKGAGWNEVMLEARKLRAAKAAGLAQGPTQRPPPQ